MAERDVLYVLAMSAYCVAAYFFVKTFAHRIWSYFLTGVLFIPYFVYIGLQMFYGPFLDFLSLASYAIFGGGVVLLLICAKVSWNHFKVLRVFFSVFALILIAVSLDAFVIEPHWLSVRREQMTTTKLTKPLKIAVVADIQTDKITSYERDVFKRIKEYEPDLLLFAGDYIQLYNEKRTEQLAAFNTLLKECGVKPTIGTFVARGDCDSPDDWAKWSEGLPYMVRDKTTTLNATNDIAVSILSLFDSRFPPYVPPKTNKFHIVLGHAPDFALRKPPADLLVAGHTHGGQVQIPGFGPPYTLSHVPRKWGGGCWTDIGTGAMLCISRGVGMERETAPRLRFMCRPEVVFIDVTPVEKRQLTSFAR